MGNNIDTYLIISALFFPFFVLFLILKTNKSFLGNNSMKKYSFNVQEPYKTFLINEEKIIEGRLNKGKFKECKMGDIFYLDDEENKEFEVWVKREYKTFKEMLENEGIQNVLPDKNNIKEGLEVYYNFYSKKDEEKYGVVAVELKKV